MVMFVLMGELFFGRDTGVDPFLLEVWVVPAFAGVWRKSKVHDSNAVVIYTLFR